MTADDVDEETSDLYGPVSYCYDLLIGEAWETLAPVVRTVLDGLEPGGAPIIDLGAGSGRGTVLAAEFVAGAEVWAVEPSPGMRAALLAHLAWRTDLLSRVTVLATSATELAWPPSVGGVLALNMIGHLGPAARAALWAVLAERLAPGAPVIVGLQPPGRPERLAEAAGTPIQVGRHTYLGRYAAEPTGIDTMRWTMTYRIEDGDSLVAEWCQTYDWWTVNPEDLALEAGVVGLSCRAVGEGLHELRLDGDPRSTRGG